MTDNALPTPADTDDEESVPVVPDLPTVTREAIERDPDGFVRERIPVTVPTKNVGNRFKPGAEWRGNAKGRAKGTKNKITVQRLLMESHLRERLAVNAEDLLEKAVLMALGGDPKIMALLLDKLMATPKNDGDDSPKDSSIHVLIENHTVQGKKESAVPPGQVRVICADETPIEGEFSNVKSSP